jgi:hypothetical protein
MRKDIKAWPSIKESEREKKRKTETMKKSKKEEDNIDIYSDKK